MVLTMARGPLSPGSPPTGLQGRPFLWSGGSRCQAGVLAFRVCQPQTSSLGSGAWSWRNQESRRKPGLGRPRCVSTRLRAGSACLGSHGKDHDGHLNLEHRDCWGRQDGFPQSYPGLDIKSDSYISPLLHGGGVLVQG